MPCSADAVAYGDGSATHRTKTEEGVEKRKSAPAADLVWAYYLVAGAFTVAAYYTAVLTGGPPVLRVTLYCLVSASAAAAVLLGCVRNRDRKSVV